MYWHPAIVTRDARCPCIRALAVAAMAPAHGVPECRQDVHVCFTQSSRHAWRLRCGGALTSAFLFACAGSAAQAAARSDQHEDVHDVESPVGSARRLGFSAGTVVGCDPLSFPSLQGTSNALGWLPTCSSWFTAGDGQSRYQACYLSCAPGTFADLSTQYSQSSAWCQSTTATAATCMGSAGSNYTCAGCALPANATKLGCDAQLGGNCFPTSEECSYAASPGIMLPALSSYSAPMPAGFTYLQCNPCTAPTPPGNLHVNPTPADVTVSLVTSRVAAAVYQCADGYYGTPARRFCSGTCSAGNTTAFPAGSCSVSGGGYWNGTWPTCTGCDVPIVDPSVNINITSGTTRAPAAILMYCADGYVGDPVTATCSPLSGVWSALAPTCMAASPTASPSSTSSTSVSASPSFTSSSSPSASYTPSGTNSASITPSNVPSPTPSETASVTAESSVTPSVTVVGSVTPSVTATSSVSLSAAVTPSFTASESASVSATSTGSDTSSPSVTSSPTASASVSPTSTASISATPAATETASSSSSASVTASVSFTSSSSVTCTADVTVSPTSSPAASPSSEPTPTITASPSVTSEPTASSTASETASSTFTPTSSATTTETSSETASTTATATPSETPSSTPTLSVTPSVTPSVTGTPTGSVSMAAASAWPAVQLTFASFNVTLAATNATQGALMGGLMFSSRRVRAALEQDMAAILRVATQLVRIASTLDVRTRSVILYSTSAQQPLASVTPTPAIILANDDPDALDASVSPLIRRRQLTAASMPATDALVITFNVLLASSGSSAPGASGASIASVQQSLQDAFGAAPLPTPLTAVFAGSFADAVDSVQGQLLFPVMVLSAWTAPQLILPSVTTGVNAPAPPIPAPDASTNVASTIGIAAGGVVGAAMLLVAAGFVRKGVREHRKRAEEGALFAPRFSPNPAAALAAANIVPSAVNVVAASTARFQQPSQRRKQAGTDSVLETAAGVGIHGCDSDSTDATEIATLPMPSPPAMTGYVDPAVKVPGSVARSGVQVAGAQQSPPLSGTAAPGGDPRAKKTLLLAIATGGGRAGAPALGTPPAPPPMDARLRRQTSDPTARSRSTYETASAAYAARNVASVFGDADMPVMTPYAATMPQAVAAGLYSGYGATAAGQLVAESKVAATAALHPLPAMDDSPGVSRESSNDSLRLGALFSSDKTRRNGTGGSGAAATSRKGSQRVGRSTSNVQSPAASPVHRARGGSAGGTPVSLSAEINALIASRGGSPAAGDGDADDPPSMLPPPPLAAAPPAAGRVRVSSRASAGSAPLVPSRFSRAHMSPPLMQVPEHDSLRRPVDALQLQDGDTHATPTPPPMSRSSSARYASPAPPGSGGASAFGSRLVDRGFASSEMATSELEAAVPLYHSYRHPSISSERERLGAHSYVHTVFNRERRSGSREHAAFSAHT